VDASADASLVDIERLTALRHVSLLNAARVHYAQPGDDAELVRACESALAVLGAAASRDKFISALIAISVHSTLADRLLDIRERQFEAATLARIQSLVESAPPLDIERLVKGEFLFARAGIAEHFSNRDRVRRGLADPSIEAIDDTRAIRELLFGASTNDEGQVLGRYAENRAVLEKLEQQSLALMRGETPGLQAPEVSLSEKLVLLAPMPGAVKFITSRAKEMNARSQLLIAALALERFRLDHGTYPASLQGLVPTYVQAMPTDPFDNQPLRYRLSASADEYTLWSISSDLKDNGGEPDMPHEPLDAGRRGDIVVTSPQVR
jgi:type II secretory pathway pseudopilin PulG